MGKAIQRCEKCAGKKQIMMLGMMMRDCGACRGVGWLESEYDIKKGKEEKFEANLEEVFLDQEQEDKPKKQERKKVKNVEIN